MSNGESVEDASSESEVQEATDEDQGAKNIPIDSSESTTDQETSQEVNDEDETDTEDERPEMKELQEKLEQVKEERNEMEEKYLRKVADLDNLRKRKKDEMKRLRKYAHKDVLEDLLEVTDNFSRALETMEFESEEVEEGVEMIHKQLLELLEKHHAKPIDADGEPFDPTVHEAMMQEEREDLEEKKVLEVFKEGYTLHDRVLRPAQVKVGVPVQEKEAESDNGES